MMSVFDPGTYQFEVDLQEESYVSRGECWKSRFFAVVGVLFGLWLMQVNGLSFCCVVS